MHSCVNECSYPCCVCFHIFNIEIVYVHAHVYIYSIYIYDVHMFVYAAKCMQGWMDGAKMDAHAHGTFEAANCRDSVNCYDPQKALQQLPEVTI